MGRWQPVGNGRAAIWALPPPTHALPTNPQDSHIPQFEGMLQVTDYGFINTAASLVLAVPSRGLNEIFGKSSRALGYVHAYFQFYLSYALLHSPLPSGCLPDVIQRPSQGCSRLPIYNLFQRKISIGTPYFCFHVKLGAPAIARNQTKRLLGHFGIKGTEYWR